MSRLFSETQNLSKLNVFVCFLFIKLFIYTMMQWQYESVTVTLWWWCISQTYLIIESPWSNHWKYMEHSLRRASLGSPSLGVCLTAFLSLTGPLEITFPAKSFHIVLRITISSRQPPLRSVCPQPVLPDLTFHLDYVPTSRFVPEQKKPTRVRWKEIRLG